MALTDEQIEILGDEYLIEMYQELERQIIQDIARRIRKTERLTETAELMAKNMHEEGYSTTEIYSKVMKALNADKDFQKAVDENTLEYKREIKKKIKKTVEDAKEAGNQLIGKAGDMAFNDDLSMWKQNGVDLKKPNVLSQLKKTFSKQTHDTLKNITQTIAFKGPVLGTVTARNAYHKALDIALLKTATGTFSYDQACKDAIKQLCDSGLRSVDYESGRTYQIDTAVRMAVRTGCSQLAGKITEINCNKTGQDLVIISQHMGSRPEHAGFQNKVYSLSGKSKKYPDIHAPLGDGCAYGSPEGLKGPNCTHNFYPFWEGISEIPEPLKESAPVAYKGKSYTRYEATQKQRAMERKVRALKRERYASQTGGEVEQLTAQIRELKAEYSRFSNAMSLKEKENRMLVGGERSKWAELKKNVPQLQIKKTREQLNKSIDKAISALEENLNVTRDELTLLFPSKVKIGVNPITDKPVYVLDKDMSYFVTKHVRDGSLKAKDLKNIGDVFNYDIVTKELDRNGNELGHMFIKKASDKEGYFDAVTKVMGNGEEIFHYQYRSSKNAKRMIKIRDKKGMVIDNKLKG